jgi:hypothetical protein
MYKKFIYLIAIVVLLAACQNSNKSGNNLGDVPDSILNQEKGTISPEAINELIESFPSPVEMAAKIRDAGVPYSKRYLVPTNYVNNYDTDLKKALGLGFYSGDLGYLNIYEQSASIVGYITTIKKLADDLNVGQFFDFNTLKQLALSNENLDSLMFLSVHSFHQMDEHLRSYNRSNLSAMVVAGVWIEGLYLATQVVKEAPNKDIAESIGEQKIILEQLVQILNNFSNDKQFASIAKEFLVLKSAYDEIKITTDVEEPVAKEVNGRLTIEQKTKDNMPNITEVQLKNIIAKTEQVRNKLIKL